jgi:hypothetical protein
MRAPTLILGVVSAVANVAGLFVDPAFGQTQPQVPPLNFAGSIHGVVLGETLEGGFPIDLAMPNAAVKVRDASDTVVGETKTNVAGTFASPVLAAGTYRVCASAVGFKEICASDSTTLVKATVALREPLTLTPLGGTLHGRVTLKDGSPAARLAIAAGNSAAAAQVRLADSGGHVLTGPVSVNTSGDYILAPVAAGSDLTVSAKYEGATVSQTLAVTTSDLQVGERVDLVLPTATPTIEGVSISINGQQVTAVAPDSIITLAVTVTNNGEGALHYRWTNVAGQSIGADSPTLTWQLPSGAGANVVFLEVTNGQGGAARASITIPMSAQTGQAGTSHAQAQPQGVIEAPGGPGAQPRALLPLNQIPINLLNQIPINLCLSSVYCPPAHSGNFIDPTLLMNGACNDEPSCETEAMKYYQTIGALDDNKQPTQTGTFKGWKAAFGFGLDPTSPASGEVRATYYNNADLRFGRDLHCRVSSPVIACYVSNYGDEMHTFGSDPQTAINNASANKGRLATVAMTYSPPPQDSTPQDYRVQFYVFDNTLNGDGNDGGLLNYAVLDSQGPKATPGVCLTCHGGQYAVDRDRDRDRHWARDSNFLPFDAPSFIFSAGQRGLLEISEREVIRQLNGFVREATYVRPTVSQLIDGWYQWCGGVNATNCYIDDVGHPFYPNQTCPGGRPSDVSCGWPTTWGGALAQSVYQRIPRVYCRTCHIAQANFLNVDSFSDWIGNASWIKGTVLASTGYKHNYMPFAQVPYDAFWEDFQSQSALAAFLNATGP